MKSFFLALGLAATLPVFAQSVPVYPTVINFGNSVQVQIFNHTNVNIYCSGSITLNTQLGRMENVFVSEYVSRGFSSNRIYNLMNWNDRILYTSNFVNCNQVP